VLIVARKGKIEASLTQIAISGFALRPKPVLRTVSEHLFGVKPRHLQRNKFVASAGGDSAAPDVADSEVSEGNVRPCIKITP
jgi:hypothetical protein